MWRLESGKKGIQRITLQKASEVKKKYLLGRMRRFCGYENESNHEGMKAMQGFEDEFRASAGRSRRRSRGIRSRGPRNSLGLCKGGAYQREISLSRDSPRKG